jgi:hypothetical protein
MQRPTFTQVHYPRLIRQTYEAPEEETAMSKASFLCMRSLAKTALKQLETGIGARNGRERFELAFNASAVIG